MCCQVAILFEEQHGLKRSHCLLLVERCVALSTTENTVKPPSIVSEGTAKNKRLMQEKIAA
jgi:hypothetical protein